MSSIALARSAERRAVEVSTRADGATDLSDRPRQLAEIHAAPAWLWPALVRKLVGKG